MTIPGMLAHSPGAAAALLVYVLPLALAAASDLRRFRIPNWLTGAMALAFAPTALLLGQDVAWLSHLGAALAVSAGAAILFACGAMGGGDVKLLAATALWTGAGEVIPFLTLVAVIGGGFALLLLLLRQRPVQEAARRLLHRLPPVMERGRPIPYGVPIAIAGVILAPALPLFR